MALFYLLLFFRWFPYYWAKVSTAKAVQVATTGNTRAVTQEPLLLAWILKLGKPGPFNGRERLEKQKAEGVTRKLVAFELRDRGVPRHGYDCYAGGEKVGHVTSGTHAPFLEKPLGMAYLPVALAEPGKTFEVDLRGRKAAAVVVPKPFYKRPK